MSHTEWLLTCAERANPRTRLDQMHPNGRAWSEGNLVRTLIHGGTYFAELRDRIDATRAGDLVLFTDWQGDADERLTAALGSDVVEVLSAAHERGVDVRGLIWRSHAELLGFSARENRRLGEELDQLGVEVLLDMRVRLGGSHHQKFVVIRHRNDTRRDIAYVGGIDLCHSRRDDHTHAGDPQRQSLAPEYGTTPPWHDIQVAITGPAVYDVETVFRERWEDATPLTRSPVRWVRDRILDQEMTAARLPEQQPPPPDAGRHAVQLLRTYPNLRHGRDYPFARGGERSVARGYIKAIGRAKRLIYIEDQYLWGRNVGELLGAALRQEPELHLIAVVPLHPDLAGMSRVPQLLGRRLAMLEIRRAAPERVAVYGIENHDSTPIYVHAKTCIVDDTWATVGSANLNRRSWTHDSELTCAVVDDSAEDHSPYARRLRLNLAAEHLDRGVDDTSIIDVMADCVEARGMFTTYAESARRLDAWHVGGQISERPPGRLRRLDVPNLGPIARALATPPYLLLHDPDGRSHAKRREDGGWGGF